MSQSPLQNNAVPERSAEQAAYEDALREVEATIMNIEAAVRRAEQARKALAASRTRPHFTTAMEQAIEELDALLRTLVQRTYFAREEHGESLARSEPSLF